MALTGDAEARTSISCREQSHALWFTDVAYATNDRMDSTVWVSSSPGSPFPDEPLDRPTVCPLDGSGLVKAGSTSPANSGVRWL